MFGSSDGDRGVFAVTADHTCELARYDRAGKWYVERKDGTRSRVTVMEAAELALLWQESGGTMRTGGCGGLAFQDRVSKLIRARKTSS